MTDPGFVPLTHPDPDRGGLVGLANIAAHHGTHAAPANYVPLVGALTHPANLFSMIHVARLLGMDAVPLEGPFTALPECPFPVIVPLKGDSPRFVVVLGVEKDTVPLLDPVDGRMDMPHAVFEAAWVGDNGHGDALAVSPGEGFGQLAGRLARARQPLRRLQWALGLTPPWPRKAVFAAALAAMPAITALQAPADLRLPALGLATALLASLWSALFGSACAACHGAARLAGGLPLGALGVTLYLYLWTGALTGDPWVGWGLWVALGVHVGLLATLAQARTTCGVCLVTAVGALTACGAWAWQTSVGLEAVAAPVALTVCLAGLAIARYHMRLAHFRGAFALAKAVFQAPRPDAGRVQAVVYKRKDCAYCLLFDAMVRPALEAEFGEVLVWEERLVAREKVDVPLLILHGAGRALVMDLRSDAAAANAVAAVRHVLAEGANPAGIYVVPPAEAGAA